MCTMRSVCTVAAVVLHLEIWYLTFFLFPASHTKFQYQHSFCKLPYLKDTNVTRLLFIYLIFIYVIWDLHVSVNSKGLIDTNESDVPLTSLRTSDDFCESLYTKIYTTLHLLSERLKCSMICVLSEYHFKWLWEFKFKYHADNFRLKMY